METIKHVRVIQDFGRLTDDEVVSTGTAVVAGLTNNKHFQTLPYDLNQLQTDVASLTAAIATAILKAHPERRLRRAIDTYPPAA